MRGRAWEYPLLFVVVVLLQVLLLDNLGLGLYVVPQIYILFIAMLPSRTPQAAVLLLALVLGAVVDALSGTAGLNVIAVLTTAFCRPWAMRVTLGADAAREGVVAVPSKAGRGRVLRYLTLLAWIQMTVYFCFEVLTLRYFYLTMIKIAASAAVSAALCYLCALLFWGGARAK